MPLISDLCLANVIERVGVALDIEYRDIKLEYTCYLY